MAGSCGERVYAAAVLATCYGGKRVISTVLRVMHWVGCGKPVGAAWLMTGWTLNARLRPRRVALRGPEARN